MQEITVNFILTCLSIATAAVCIKYISDLGMATKNAKMALSMTVRVPTPSKNLDQINVHFSGLFLLSIHHVHSNVLMGLLRTYRRHLLILTISN